MAGRNFDVERVLPNCGLDLDATLIDSIPVEEYQEILAKHPGARHPDMYHSGHAIFVRPNLRLFLGYVFRNCANVFIWTAADAGWADPILEELIYPRLRARDDFDFIWRFPQCKRTTFSDRHVGWSKPLSKVYAAYPGKYSMTNTVFVDDNPDSYVYNPQNAIAIQRYDARRELTKNYQDDHLLRAITMIMQIEEEMNDSRDW